MKHKADFDLDLARGQVGEQLVKRLITQEDLKVEVKSDFKAQHTGNVAIELQSRDKPSGLSITTADYWAIVLNNGKQVIFIETEKLRQMVLEAKYRRVRGGDNNTSELVLVPLCDMVK